MTLTRKRETAGRCAGCDTIWTWTGRLRLRDATCPTCGAKLARTAVALVKDKRVIKAAHCTSRGLVKVHNTLSSWVFFVVRESQGVRFTP
jgi:hypothetical protein